MNAGFTNLLVEGNENIQPPKKFRHNPVKEISSAASILLTFKPSVDYAKSLESFKTEKEFANLFVFNFDSALQSLREKCLVHSFQIQSVRTEATELSTNHRYKKLHSNSETTIGPLRFLQHLSQNRNKNTYSKVSKSKELSLSKYMRIIAKELGKVLSFFD